MNLLSILQIFVEISVLVIGAICLIRFKLFPVAFRPYCYNNWIGVAGIIVYRVSISTVGSNAIDANVSSILDFLTIAWFYYLLNGRINDRNLFIAFASLAITAFVVDNFIFHNIFIFNSASYIFFNLMTVYLIIDHINRMVITERRSLLREPVFLISLSLLTYYSLSLVMEMFYFLKLDLEFPTHLTWLLSQIKAAALIISNSVIIYSLLKVKSSERLILPFLYQ